MRKFRVIDGSDDGSVVAPAAEPATEPAPPDPAPAQAPPPAPAPDVDGAGGLVTASTNYHAALQTTKKIRQRSLLDFLR
jgi:hypothetical protein